MVLLKQLALCNGRQVVGKNVETVTLVLKAATDGELQTGLQPVETSFLPALDQRIERRYLLGKMEKPNFLHLHLLPDLQDDALFGIFDGIEYTLQMGDEKGCGSSRGFNAGVAHHVEYTLVALMANASDDRYGEISHMLSQGQSVEA